MGMRILVLSLGFFLICAGAAHAHASPASSTVPGKPVPKPPTWQDLRWADRAVHALRGGEGLSAQENLATLLKDGRASLVTRLLADPRFADTVLDFNLYVLGFKQDRIRKENGNYQDIIYELPNAIRSAQSILNQKGDYLSLFDLEFPFYVGPLGRARQTQPGDEKRDRPGLRHAQEERIQAALDAVILIAQTEPENAAKICAAYTGFRSKFVFSNLLQVSATLLNSVEFATNWYGAVNSLCGGGKVASMTLLSALQQARAQNDRLFAKMERLDPDLYHPQSVVQLRSLDFQDMGITFHQTPFSFTFAKNLPNSSTNYDRKRAAYYLNRFFCDDMVPINVETPSIHAGGAHGTDPACMACHYKLDPMAGFFRDFGSRFRDYSQSKRITFDDGASAPRDEYLKSWQPGPDADHSFNVGYVRSERDLSQNTYGSSLRDLYSILKTAPEVRRCLTRRLFSYFNSEGQTVDGDFLDFLTEQFNQTMAQSSAASALKQAVKKIVLSRTFSQANPDVSQCYDFRPGHPTGSGAPCRIASIVAKNCTTCHHSTDAAPFLDFSRWGIRTDGKMGFLHRSGDGTEVATSTTFQQMRDRLSETDSQRRMPLLSNMPDPERAELYKWLTLEMGRP